MAIWASTFRRSAGWRPGPGRRSTCRATPWARSRSRGTVAVDGAVYGVKDADIKLDAIAAKGSFTADTGGAKPYLNGQLAVGDLDVNPYLPAESESGGTAADKPATADAGAQGWSEEPMDFSGLKAANLDFDLTVDSILIRKIQIGKGALALKLKDGIFTADLKELALYEGTGSGSVTLDASGKVPSLKKSFSLEGVQAQPLLADAAGFDRLAGTAQADYTIAARGLSQLDMVKNLNGKGGVKFANGAIVGINLAAMVRNVSTAFLDSSAGETQKTDFSELSGTFTIANGLLKNDDLSLQSPLLRVNGAGTSDLPARTLDYRVEPKFAATLEGQGGAQKVAGVDGAGYRFRALGQPILQAGSRQPGEGSLQGDGYGKGSQIRQTRRQAEITDPGGRTAVEGRAYANRVGPGAAVQSPGRRQGPVGREEVGWRVGFRPDLRTEGEPTR